MSACKEAIQKLATMGSLPASLQSMLEAALREDEQRQGGVFKKCSLLKESKTSTASSSQGYVDPTMSYQGAVYSTSYGPVRVCEAKPRAGAHCVILGLGSTSDHDHCVLIGAGLTSERAYQVKIGNSEVEVSRQMTHDEFMAIFDAMAQLTYASDAKRAELIRQAEQTKPGQPVAWISAGNASLLNRGARLGHASLSPRRDEEEGLTFPLYTHADPGEVERLRDQLAAWQALAAERLEVATGLRAQLAERDALLREVSSFIDECAGRETMASGPAQRLAFSLYGALSASAEHDERAEFESKYHLHSLIRDGVSGSYLNTQVRDFWDAWQARAAMERKP